MKRFPIPAVRKLLRHVIRDLRSEPRNCRLSWNSNGDVSRTCCLVEQLGARAVRGTHDLQSGIRQAWTPVSHSPNLPGCEIRKRYLPRHASGDASKVPLEKHVARLLEVPSRKLLKSLETHEPGILCE